MTFSEKEGEEEPLEGEELAELEEAFFLSSSFLEGGSGGKGLSESLETQSVAPPGTLDEPVSRGEEKEEERWKNW